MMKKLSESFKRHLDSAANKPDKIGRPNGFRDAIHQQKPKGKPVIANNRNKVPITDR